MELGTIKVQFVFDTRNNKAHKFTSNQGENAKIRLYGQVCYHIAMSENDNRRECPINITCDSQRQYRNEMNPRTDLLEREAVYISTHFIRLTR